MTIVSEARKVSAKVWTLTDAAGAAEGVLQIWINLNLESKKKDEKQVLFLKL
jgi:hypothetical protein